MMAPTWDIHGPDWGECTRQSALRKPRNRPKMTDSGIRAGGWRAVLSGTGLISWRARSAGRNREFPGPLRWVAPPSPSGRRGREATRGRAIGAARRTGERFLVLLLADACMSN